MFNILYENTYLLLSLGYLWSVTVWSHTWGRSLMYSLLIYPGPTLTISPNPKAYPNLNLTLNLNLKLKLSPCPNRFIVMHPNPSIAVFITMCPHFFNHAPPPPSCAYWKMDFEGVTCATRN